MAGGKTDSRAARLLLLPMLAILLGIGLTVGVAAASAGLPPSNTAGPSAQETTQDQDLPSKTNPGGKSVFDQSKAQPDSVDPLDCTVTGSITTSDPFHADYVNADNTPSTCPSEPCDGEVPEPGTWHYDAVPFTNSSGSAQCVTITITANCGDVNGLYSAAYLNSFDPNNLCTNFLGDSVGLIPSGETATYSVTVPAGATFYVDVEEYTETEGCAAYTLAVVGTGITCGAGGTPTASTTAVGTATRTATVAATTTAAATSTHTATVQATATHTATVMATTTHTATVQATGTVTQTAQATATRTATRTAVIGTATVTPCQGRVTICHQTGNGSSHTITVACAALPAHLMHGDTLGPCPAGTPRPNYFSDITPTDYFFDHVLDLRDAGAISGYNDGTFRPYNYATRGQFVKIVVLAFDIPLYTGNETTFTDVPATHTFYRHIETAHRSGLVSGYADGTFRPSNNVTRGQLSKIAVEAAGWPDLSTSVPSFSDVPTNHTFYNYIETAYANGILSGYADGTFRPNNSATRGQISKLINLATDAE